MPNLLAPHGKATLRERLLDLGPIAALGLVLAMLWAFVSWFAWTYRDELRREHERDLSSLANAAASQTEEVLRDAEISLRTVDLWLRTRDTAHPLNDASLVQMVETLHTSTRTMIEIVLADPAGWLYRIPSPSGQAFHQLKGQPFVANLAQPDTNGFQLGRAFRFSPDSPLRLPMAMRLGTPRGGISTVIVLVNLDRLQQLQSLYLRGTEGSVAMFSREGEVLSRAPELPGFVGQQVYETRPDLRRALMPQSGVFHVQDSPADGQPRTAAFETITDFGVKMILAEGESKALGQHRTQRLVVLALAAILSMAAMLTTMVLVRQHRTLRERDAELLATSDASPLGLFRADASGKLLWANETYLRLHGLAADEVAWGWLLLMPEGGRANAKARWQAACAEGKPIDMVRNISRRDGTELLVALRTAPLRINGKIAGQAGTVSDITAQAAHERAQRMLHAIFDMTPDYIGQMKLNGDLFYLNPAARRRIGLAPDASLAGMNYTRFTAHERQEVFRQEILPAAIAQGHWTGRTSLYAPDGTEVPVDSTALVHRNDRGDVEAISMVLRDLTSETLAQRERLRSEAILRAVAQTAPVLIAVLDTEQRYIYFNQSYGQHFGTTIEAWRGRHIRELIGEEQYELSRPAIEAALRGQHKDLEKAYSDRPELMILDVRYSPLRLDDGEIAGAICIARDVTAARAEEARLRHASQTDALTQLLNRAGFALAADEKLAIARQHNHLMALLYLDLDRFKPINDQYGHPMGDALLRAVAGRIRHALRPNDLAARLGGDEFAVLLTMLHGPEDAEMVATKLVQAIASPFMIEQHDLHIGCSVGFCVAWGGQADLERMVAEADAKLYEAKRGGRGTWRGSQLDGTSGKDAPLNETPAAPA
ncbi:diguanylate cyclase domain-containing protein [Roseateles microcysteis]|uniref:diguanylate cyclase domain-containing protein n=1 Tax=Roseateles microcysteis TaxID=3119057 RepID=UPI002FE63EC9